MIRKLLMLIICVMIVGGCKKTDKAESAIVVNGQSIPRIKVDQAAEVLRQSIVRAYPQKSLQAMGGELYKAAAQQLVANILMLEDAKKKGIKVDSAKVDSSIQMIKKRFPDQAAFQRELTLAGQTEESMRKQFTEGMVLDSLLKSMMKGIDSVKESECLAFYEKNRDKYVSAPRSKASQLLFPIDSAADAQKKEQIQKDASEALQAVKSGKKMEDVAKKYSSRKAIGGDIGWFKKGDLKPVLEESIMKMKKGDISDPIQTDVGIVILQKTDEEAGKALPYEEVKSHVKYMTDMKKRNEFVTDYIDKLIKKTKVTYNDTSLIPLPSNVMDSLLLK